MSQQNQKNNELRINVLLAILFGLIGEVSPLLRAIQVRWNEEIIFLFFYYDGEISPEDEESAQCIATQVIANFSNHLLELEIVRCDYPNKIPETGELVYKRREP